MSMPYKLDTTVGDYRYPAVVNGSHDAGKTLISPVNSVVSSILSEQGRDSVNSHSPHHSQPSTPLHLHSPDGRLSPQGTSLSVTSAGSSLSNAQKLKLNRSKTGCLTCRAKRIKCSEAKPVCRQCSEHNRACRWQGGTRTGQVQSLQPRVDRTSSPSQQHVSVDRYEPYKSVSPRFKSLEYPAHTPTELPRRMSPMPAQSLRDSCGQSPYSALLQQQQLREQQLYRTSPVAIDPDRARRMSSQQEASRRAAQAQQDTRHSASFSMAPQAAARSTPRLNLPSFEIPPPPQGMSLRSKNVSLSKLVSTCLAASVPVPSIEPDLNPDAAKLKGALRGTPCKPLLPLRQLCGASTSTASDQSVAGLRVCYLQKFATGCYELSFGEKVGTTAQQKLFTLVVLPVLNDLEPNAMLTILDPARFRDGAQCGIFQESYVSAMRDTLGTSFHLLRSWTTSIFLFSMSIELGMYGQAAQHIAHAVNCFKQADIRAVYQGAATKEEHTLLYLTEATFRSSQQLALLTGTRCNMSRAELPDQISPFDQLQRSTCILRSAATEALTQMAGVQYKTDELSRAVAMAAQAASHRSEEMARVRSSEQQQQHELAKERAVAVRASEAVLWQVHECEVQLARLAHPPMSTREPAYTPLAQLVGELCGPTHSRAHHGPATESLLSGMAESVLRSTSRSPFGFRSYEHHAWTAAAMGLAQSKILLASLVHTYDGRALIAEYLAMLASLVRDITLTVLVSPTAALHASHLGGDSARAAVIAAGDRRRSVLADDPPTLDTFGLLHVGSLLTAHHERDWLLEQLSLLRQVCSLRRSTAPASSPSLPRQCLSQQQVQRLHGGDQAGLLLTIDDCVTILTDCWQADDAAARAVVAATPPGMDHAAAVKAAVASPAADVRRLECLQVLVRQTLARTAV